MEDKVQLEKLEIAEIEEILELLAQPALLDPLVHVDLQVQMVLRVNVEILEILEKLASQGRMVSQERKDLEDQQVQLDQLDHQELKALVDQKVNKAKLVLEAAPDKMVHRDNVELQD